jgi:hypothetical protein
MENEETGGEGVDGRERLVEQNEKKGGRGDDQKGNRDDFLLEGGDRKNPCEKARRPGIPAAGDAAVSAADAKSGQGFETIAGKLISFGRGILSPGSNFREEKSVVKNHAEKSVLPGFCEVLWIK